MKTLETIDSGKLDSVSGGADQYGDKAVTSAAGAVIGGYAGLLCGPGAPVCSPILAAVGSVVGWKIGKEWI